MDIKKELQNLKSEVDKEIELHLDRVIAETKDVDIFVTGALKYFKKTILAGGKRIRPIMMYWGYKAAGGTNDTEILKTSISIELIHAFLLMHDDVIDRDDLRHGKKTLHAQYRDYNKRFLFGKDSEHFGASIAIVMGDFIFSLGNQVLFESKFDANIIIRALNKMQDIVGLTCVGEIQDVHMEYKQKVTDEEILQMYRNKTAKYTFEGPLQLGAMLAGAQESFYSKLGDYSVPLGVAFQIRDDMLGVFGDEKKTGKPVGSDIMEGKKTLLMSKAYNRVSREQKKVLDKCLGNQEITKKDIKEVQDILQQCGAKKEVEDYMKKLIEKSQNALTEIDLGDDVREFLFELSNYLNKREY